MEIFANELAFESFSFDSKNDIDCLIETYNAIRLYEINTCRIPKECYSNLVKYVSQKKDRNLMNFIYSFFKTPFEDNDAVNDVMEMYLSNDWKYKEQSCLGLAVAYLLDSVALSIQPEQWPDPLVEIRRDGVSENARNITTGAHVLFHSEWFESLKKTDLIKTDLCPEDKRISLRDDHGKDVLEKFAKKLRNCEYVTQVINSLPFNSHSTSFIRKSYSDGRIELVLFWTDKGYGLVVQTTGRNLRETKEISRIIDEEYGYP